MSEQHTTKGQRGYVLALTACLFPFLLAFTAMVVDIGTWYVQAQANQRAADAAALAGVVWLPDMAKAEAVARQTAEKNGLYDTFNATILVDRPSENQLRVRVGTASRLFFGRLFLNEFAITRSSLAEYTPPVALGSPKNSLGTGNLGAPDFPGGGDGFWLAASGFCSVAENGDLRLARFSAAYRGSGVPAWYPAAQAPYPPSCPSSTAAAIPPNPMYTGQYAFAIEVPPSLTGQITVQAFDPIYDPWYRSSDGTRSPTDREYARLPHNSGNPGNSPPSRFQTHFTLRRPHGFDTTPFNPFDNPVVAISRNPRTVEAANPSSAGGPLNPSLDTWGGWRNRTTYFGSPRWVNLWGPFTPPGPGTYYLTVTTTCVNPTPCPIGTGHNHKRSAGSNGFALRVKRGGSAAPWTSCTAIVGEPGYAANCPQVYALNDLPVYASLNGFTTDFYLAQIGPEHSGKMLEITLFDVGEGAEGIRVIDPNGVPVTFDYEAYPCDGSVPSTTCEGTTNELDVSGDGPQPDNNYRYSESKYNDRRVVIRVPIGTYPGDWWKIRYIGGANVTDRSTWSVKVVGDPVRLAD